MKCEKQIGLTIVKKFVQIDLVKTRRTGYENFWFSKHSVKGGVN